MSSRAALLLDCIERHEFLIIGHRGAAGLSPENTLASFQCALQWQCPMLELDVHRSVNNAGEVELIVIHDAKLNRTTDGRGLLADFSTEQLRTFDAGRGQRIPLLIEVLDLLSEHHRRSNQLVALNIELKGAGTAEPVAALLATDPGLPVLVSSFDHRELGAFRALDAETALAPLYDKWDPGWRKTAEALGAAAVNLGAKIASETRVRSIREAGYAVFVYTVNSKREARRLRAMGVSGVFTDRPDKLMELIED